MAGKLKRIAVSTVPVTRHMVLPPNPDTWFCRLIPTHGFAGVTDKE